MSPAPQRIGVVTGSRAEFGLLSPVMEAIEAREDTDLRVIVAGAHFLAPAETHREVAARFDVAASVALQRDDETGRFADARSAGRGVRLFAEAFERLACDWVVGLGDRIEPFAAAAAASIGGVPFAHLHGGDRAEGVADESMRHAISKLAHLHLTATEASAERLERMGEDPERIHVVGSPAIDGLREVEAMGDERAEDFGDPEIVLLLHPVGDGHDEERRRAESALAATRESRTLALHPNHDPGREGIVAALESGRGTRDDLHVEAHLAREEFLALLARLAARGGVLVGNSSAGLIECAGLGLPSVDIGERQAGRERPGNAVHVRSFEADQIAEGIDQARRLDRTRIEHPYGDGDAGARAAAVIAEIDTREASTLRSLLRKRNTY
jgi:UDP-hydrolysing UDP-N-acetyl-D-glucosamine 2-epimerase